jgi:hypothetical protein
MQIATGLSLIPKIRFPGSVMLKNAKYFISSIALILVAVMGESCYILDDDNTIQSAAINARSFGEGSLQKTATQECRP